MSTLLRVCWGLAFSGVAYAATPFAEWADRVTADWMKLDPQFATTVQYFAGPEQDRLDRELTPVHAAHRAQRIALARRILEELPQHSGLSAEDAVSAKMLGWLLDDYLRGEAFDQHDFVFEQFRGLQVTLVNFLTQTHPIRHRRDVENYLARLRQVAVRLDEGVREAQQAAEQRFVPPRFIVERTREQLARFLEPAAADNVLVSSLRERIRKVPDLEADASALLEDVHQVVASDVLPAFRRVERLLEQQLVLTSNDAGLWRLPQGEVAYAQSLRTYTTTALTAEEIHSIGLQQVAAIEAEMDRILRELGYRDGTVEARYLALETSLQPAADPDARAGLLARYTAIVREAEERARPLFDVRPRAPVEVRREPPFTEKTAAARYTLPAPDGSRPGVFWVPLPGPHFEVLRMRSLSYHEAVPGHHFQVALQQEQTTLPRFRRVRVFGGLSVFAEGWALYAERLADELGWYENDRQGQLGYLSSQLFRARRLVVDTGLHAKRWTREQAIAYGIKAQEIERYVVLPGQACSYMIGQLKILELRDHARRQLGERFQLRDFHTLVLTTGAVPLEVLTEVVERWIEAQRRAT